VHTEKTICGERYLILSWRRTTKALRGMRKMFITALVEVEVEEDVEGTCGR